MKIVLRLFTKGEKSKVHQGQLFFQEEFLNARWLLICLILCLARIDSHERLSFAQCSLVAMGKGSVADY